MSAKEKQEARKESYPEPLDPANVVSHLGNDLEYDFELDTFSYMTSHFKKPNYDARYEFSNYVIDPLKWRFRKVVRVLALVILFVQNIKKRVNKATLHVSWWDQKVPYIFENQHDKHIVTTGCQMIRDPWKCLQGLVVTITDRLVNLALNYYFEKSTSEIIQFLDKNHYDKFSELKGNVLYYSGRILSDQEFGGAPH